MTSRPWPVGWRFLAFPVLGAWALSLGLLTASAGATPAQDGPPSSPPAPPSAPSPVLSPAQEAALARARQEVARKVRYDSTYRTLTYTGERDTGRKVYPGGDLDPTRGVCTDVVVRALRVAGLDLQSKVHDDVLRRPGDYKPFVGFPDANIDHRRVGPLLVFFRGMGPSLPQVVDASTRGTFQPGDVVVWSFRGTHPDHVGLVSDRTGPRGFPLVLHNLGPHPTEDDTLDAWPLLGHFRPLP